MSATTHEHEPFDGAPQGECLGCLEEEDAATTARGAGMSPIDVTTVEATVALPVSTLIRILAVLDDAEQVYVDLVEAGAAEPWNDAELDSLRVAVLFRLVLEA